MRVIFINYIHPETPHVSSMRLRYFAETLARRGHRVVLLTRTLYDGEAGKTVVKVSEEFANQDWSRPYFLACAPVKHWHLERIRDPQTSRWLRKALIFGQYAFGEGLFSDWTVATRPYWPVLASRFKPDVTLGTFGNLDSWVIARGIAKAANVPWVMDAKDGWEVFIHPLLRHWLACRFNDAAALTSNSGYLAEQYARWFPQRAEIIYSGVDENWIQPSSPPLEGFRIMLVGSVYDKHYLEHFVRGLRAWLEALTPGERGLVCLDYAGSDMLKVESAMAELAGLCRTEIHAYMPLTELANLCRGAAVNAYLWNPKTFHHKLVELLCCQRPIISFPGERAESILLSQRVGGSLNVCLDERGLQDALTQIWHGGLQPTSGPEQLRELTWEAQADHLEEVLRRVAVRTLLS